MYVVPFLSYSASKNSVTLKLEVGFVPGHRKWRRSIDHIRLSIGQPLYRVSIVVCCTIFKLFDVE